MCSFAENRLCFEDYLQLSWNCAGRNVELTSDWKNDGFRFTVVQSFAFMLCFNLKVGWDSNLLWILKSYDQGGVSLSDVKWPFFWNLIECFGSPWFFPLLCFPIIVLEKIDVLYSIFEFISCDIVCVFVSRKDLEYSVISVQALHRCRPFIHSVTCLNLSGAEFWMFSLSASSMFCQCHPPVILLIIFLHRCVHHFSTTADNLHLIILCSDFL